MRQDCVIGWGLVQDDGTSVVGAGWQCFEGWGFQKKGERCRNLDRDEPGT